MDEDQSVRVPHGHTSNGGLSSGGGSHHPSVPLASRQPGTPKESAAAPSATTMSSTTVRPSTDRMGKSWGDSTPMNPNYPANAVRAGIEAANTAAFSAPEYIANKVSPGSYDRVKKDVSVDPESDHASDVAGKVAGMLAPVGVGVVRGSMAVGRMRAAANLGTDELAHAIAGGTRF